MSRPAPPHTPTVLRCASWVALVAMTACRTPAPADAPIATVWAWSDEDQPYVVLGADGTLTHRGEFVGRLDLERRAITVPSVADSAPYDELGPLTREGDVTWAQLMRPRFGIGPDGSIQAARVSESLDVEDSVGPWGRMEPADAPEPVRSGLLWALLLWHPRQPVSAGLELRFDAPPCGLTPRASASALGDGRIVEAALCPIWAACDVGPPLGSWDASGRILLAGSASDRALDDLVRSEGAVTAITPIGESVPWFTVDGQGYWSTARTGPFPMYFQPSALGSVRSYDPSRAPLAQRDAQAAALLVASAVADQWRRALAECPDLAPPPPPPPPPAR